MKFSYDPQADALSLRLTDARIDDTDEIQPGIIVDYDEDGQVVAVEMLNVRKRIQPVEVDLQNQFLVPGINHAETEILVHEADDVPSPYSTARNGVFRVENAAGKMTVAPAEAPMPVEHPVSA